MTTLPGLSDAAIRERVGDKSFQRGFRYFSLNRISDPRRQGATIKGRCRGSASEPYRVKATIDVHGFSQSECTCPVGASGTCKHVVALLLTWRARPDSFLEIKDLDVVLEGQTKAELIALIKRLLSFEPDLEALLEVPIANRSTVTELPS